MKGYRDIAGDGGSNIVEQVVAQQGRLDVAASHFREAVRLRPDFRDAHSNLARAQAELARR